MTWTVIFLILAILVAIAGIWHLAQRKTFFLSLIGLFWVLVILFRFYFPNSYNFQILPGLVFASLIEYIAIPILLILAFFTARGRR